MTNIEQIVIWGDSLLGGVVLSPNHKYAKLAQKSCVAAVERNLSVPIKNFARFGMTSEKGLHFMEKSLAPDLSGVAVIEFGGNDVDYNWNEIAQDPDSEHLPKVLPEAFARNMEEMVTLAKQHNLEPVMVTLPPIDSRRYFNWFSRSIEKKDNILKWLGDIDVIYRSQEFYSQIVEAIAKKLQVRLIDVRKAFLRQRCYQDFLCDDGIHPNERGHALMADVFLDYAQAALV